MAQQNTGTCTGCGQVKQLRDYSGELLIEAHDIAPDPTGRTGGTPCTGEHQPAEPVTELAPIAGGSSEDVPSHCEFTRADARDGHTCGRPTTHIATPYDPTMPVRNCCERCTDRAKRRGYTLEVLTPDGRTLPAIAGGSGTGPGGMNLGTVCNTCYAAAKNMLYAEDRFDETSGTIVATAVAGYTLSHQCDSAPTNRPNDCKCGYPHTYAELCNLPRCECCDGIAKYTLGGLRYCSEHMPAQTDLAHYHTTISRPGGEPFETWRYVEYTQAEEDCMLATLEAEHGSRKVSIKYTVEGTVIMVGRTKWLLKPTPCYVKHD